MTIAPVKIEADERALRERWAAEGAPVWADGNRLTLVCERSAPHVVVWPVLQLIMERVAPGFFALTVEVERLDEALISYAFWELDETGTPITPRPPDPDGRFRGERARPEAASNRTLVGSLTDHVLASEALDAERRVAVYTPPNSSPAGALPAVYATDGGLGFVGYARRLDAAIESGATPPVIVVAAHSARADHQGNVRAMEYIPGFDPGRFDAHRRFFTEELPRWAEREFAVADDRRGRAVFGCSDGAVHALTLAQECPDFAAHTIAYSGGMPPDQATRLDPTTSPFLHLGAGTLEGGFHQASEAWAAYCHFAKIPYSWTETVAGHDLIQWCENLPRALHAAFG